ncbi:MAG: hypothetical protein WAV13_09035 [Thermodesulfovibrionales bacterium]
MLIGYNTNVPYKGEIYHVQTEDSGLKSPVIITLLYLKGTILASKKTSYSDLVASPDYKEKVRELMKEQHKAMLRELIAGKHTVEIQPSAKPDNENIAPENTALGQTQDNAANKAEPKTQIAKSLDDILLDYIIKKNK